MERALEAVANGIAPPLASCLETTLHDYSRADGFTTIVQPVSVALRGRDGGAAAEVGDDRAFTLRSSKGGGDKPHVLAPAVVGALTTGTGSKLGAPEVDAGQYVVAPAIGFYSNEGSHGMGANVDISPSVKIGSGTGAVPPAVAFNWQEGAGGDLGMSDALTGVAPPVRAHQTLATQSSSIVRRLTPVECCRLQGFPDNWNAEGVDAAGKRIPMADSNRYRQLGNAVTVNVANWLATNVAKVYASAQGADDGQP